MLRETHLYEENLSNKGLALLCEAVCISSTGTTNLIRDKSSPDINDSAVGVESNAPMVRVIEKCVPTRGGINSPSISDSTVRTDIDIKVSMVKVAENSDSTRIEITFRTGERGRFIVNKRKRGKGFSLYVYVSSGLTGGRHRYVYLKIQYGCGDLFQRFVEDQVKKCVSAWKSRGDAQRWCESNLDSFKQWVETGWQLKRSRSTRDEIPPIRPARRDTTVSIPLYRFLLEGQVPAIRITYAWHRKTRPYLLVCFPGVIFVDKKMRKKSMKSRFGHDKQWFQFVEGYVRTAVNQWKTLEDARIWYRDSRFEFWTGRLWEIYTSCVESS